MSFLTNYSCVNGQLIETRKMNVYIKKYRRANEQCINL